LDFELRTQLGVTERALQRRKVLGYVHKTCRSVRDILHGGKRHIEQGSSHGEDLLFRL
jgi:hypothetical protein